MLREANQSSNSLSDPAESVETALSRLGLSRCETLLNQAPALPENEIPLAFRQILLISQHASQQAVSYTHLDVYKRQLPLDRR